MTTETVQAYDGHIVVEPETRHTEHVEGGIIFLPGGDPRGGDSETGIVVSCGCPITPGQENFPPPFNAGDRVLFSKFSGSNIRVGDRKLVAMLLTDILAMYTDGNQQRPFLGLPVVVSKTVPSLKEGDIVVARPGTPPPNYLAKHEKALSECETLEQLEAAWNDAYNDAVACRLNSYDWQRLKDLHQTMTDILAARGKTGLVLQGPNGPQLYS